jgi:hypothetical protein
MWRPLTSNMLCPLASNMLLASGMWRPLTSKMLCPLASINLLSRLASNMRGAEQPIEARLLRLCLSHKHPLPHRHTFSLPSLVSISLPLTHAHTHSLTHSHKHSLYFSSSLALSANNLLSRWASDMRGAEQLIKARLLLRRHRLPSVL